MKSAWLMQADALAFVVRGSQYLRRCERADAEASPSSASSSESRWVPPCNVAYCWGYNFFGEVGDGTTARRLTPVRVFGGLSFGQLSTGGGHTCGRTTDAAGYCWGNNFSGELGDGTTTSRLKPRAVVGPM